MALPIELDTKHWISVPPVGGRTEVVTCRSFACFYSNAASPPELNKETGRPPVSESTELATGSTVTLETPNGKWFIAKVAGSTEIQLPSLLELGSPASPEAIGTEEIQNEAVTAAKIAKEAVTAAKVQIATLPAIAAVKTVKTGTSGVDRVSISNLKGDGGTTLIYKIKHSLETFAVAVTCYSNSSNKPGTQITGAEIPTIVASSASEVTLTFGAGKPANEEIIWVKVEA